MPSIRVLLVCLLAVVCVAQANDKQQAFQVYVENDSRALKPNHNTDRHYTHGTKLVYLMQPDWQWVDDFSTWHFGDAEQSVDTAIGIFLGQNI
ncbi:MAG: lipid A-modifier LpxR family protein, partial [Planctomycetota bacterium]